MEDELDKPLEWRAAWIIRWVIILSAALLTASGFTLLVMNGAVTNMGPIAFFAGAGAASIVPAIELSLRRPLVLFGIGLGLTASFMLEVLVLGITASAVSTLGVAGFLVASLYVFVMAGISVIIMP